MNDKHSGLFVDAGVYSFYATKAIPAGEGGMVVTHDDDLGNQLENYILSPETIDGKRDGGLGLESVASLCEGQGGVFLGCD